MRAAPLAHHSSAHPDQHQQPTPRRGVAAACAPNILTRLRPAPPTHLRVRSRVQSAPADALLECLVARRNCFSTTLRREATHPRVHSHRQSAPVDALGGGQLAMASQPDARQRTAGLACAQQVTGGRPQDIGRVGASAVAAACLLAVQEQREDLRDAAQPSFSSRVVRHLLKDQAGDER